MKKITIHDDLYAFLNDLDARVSDLEGGDAEPPKDMVPAMAEAFSLAEPMKDKEPEPAPIVEAEPAKMEEVAKGE